VTPAHRPGPGRPIDRAKRDAILLATRKLINAKGLSLTIDDVADHAGVARQTVYNAFGGKDQLIAAVIGESVAMMVHPLADPALAGDMRQTLRELGRRYVEMVFQPQSIALARAMIAQGERGRRAVELFFRDGPEQAYASLRAFLDQRCAAGELDIADLDQAVEHFYGLLRGTAHFRLTMGAIDPLDAAALQRRVDAGVEAFLRAYALR